MQRDQQAKLGKSRLGSGAVPADVLRSRGGREFSCSGKRKRPAGLHGGQGGCMVGKDRLRRPAHLLCVTLRVHGHDHIHA